VHRSWPTARLGLFAVALVGCSRDAPARRTPASSREGTRPPEHGVSANATSSLWDSTAGPFFAVAGEAPSEAQLVYPDYTSQQRLDTLHVDRGALLNAQMDLLAPGDSTGVARVVDASLDTAQRCSTWPTLQLSGPDRHPVSRSWTVAFPRGRARGVSYDSLPDRSRADSVRLTIAIARAASKAPGDTASSFRGRPYVVRQANLFTMDDGTAAVLAEVARTVNQEANPLQEQLVLVLERGPGKADDELAVAYSERTVGLEEALESVELISVVQFRSGTWAFLVRRDIGDGFSYSLFERRAPQTWALRWRSAHAGC
jgi:hypothetical protein